jgi:hypothetical protein
VHNSRNTTWSGLGAGGEFPVQDPVHHAALPRRPEARNPQMESLLPARALFEAARCVICLPDTAFEEATTVSVV